MVTCAVSDAVAGAGAAAAAGSDAGAGTPAIVMGGGLRSVGSFDH